MRGMLVLFPFLFSKAGQCWLYYRQNWRALLPYCRLVVGGHTRVHYRSYDHVYRGPLCCDVSHGSGVCGCDLFLIPERLLLRLMCRFCAHNGMGVQRNTTPTCETVCRHRHREWLREYRKPVRGAALRSFLIFLRILVQRQNRIVYLESRMGPWISPFDVHKSCSAGLQFPASPWFVLVAYAT